MPDPGAATRGTFRLLWPQADPRSRTRPKRRGHGAIERIEILDAGPDQAVLGVAGPRFRDVEQASPNSKVFILMTVPGGRIVRMRDSELARTH